MTSLLRALLGHVSSMCSSIPQPHCWSLTAHVCRCLSLKFSTSLAVGGSFLQLSVVATCATECGGLSRDSQFRKKSNDVFCCTARLVNDVRTIIPCLERTRSKSRTLIRCQDLRRGGIAIRDGEGCFSVGGGTRMVADRREDRRVVRSK